MERRKHAPAFFFFLCPRTCVWKRVFLFIKRQTRHHLPSTHLFASMNEDSSCLLSMGCPGDLEFSSLYSVISIVFGLIGQCSGSVFANWDLYTLLRKALAECCAFYDTRELFGRVDSKRVGEAGSEHGRLLSVCHDVIRVVTGTNVEDHELQSAAISTEK